MSCTVAHFGPCPACGGRGWTPNPEAVKRLGPLFKPSPVWEHPETYRRTFDAHSSYVTGLLVGLVDYALQGGDK